MKYAARIGCQDGVKARPGFQHAEQFPEPEREVTQVPHAEADGGAVEVAVGERQFQRVGGHRDHTR